MEALSPEPERSTARPFDKQDHEVRIGSSESDMDYREWDRREWVGEGQEPPDAPLSPIALEPEIRWTKWEWIGEGQGSAGPNRGAPAAAMPDGENALSGRQHNPGMAHWGGRRPYLRRGEPRDRIAATAADRRR